LLAARPAWRWSAAVGRQVRPRLRAGAQRQPPVRTSNAVVAGHTLAYECLLRYELVDEQASKFNLNASGAGPMRVKQFQQNDRALLEPFPDYWDKGADGKPLPYLDQFVDRYIPDLATALVELQSGGVDIVEDMPPRDVAAAKSNADLIFREMPWSATEYLNLGFNMSLAPFTNGKIRQAMLYGMDREAMVKAVGFGTGAAMYYNSTWLPGSLGYDESIMQYKYDADNKFETCVWRGGMAADPDLLTSVRTGGGTNYSNYSDPQIDEWMKEAGATLDTNQRAALYSKVITQIQDQAYVGSGFQAPKIYGYHKNIHGLRLNYDRVAYPTAWKG
jgi:ABC-type transport system substrate-binding protein